MCALCSSSNESKNHLFVHCQVVWKLWSAILNREWSYLADVSDAFLWNLSPYALVLSLWLSRNEKLFNNKVFKAYAVWDMHLLKISWWTKSYWKDWPYDSSHFFSNLSNITVCKSVPLSRVAVCLPPSSGFLKFNLDGASQGNSGPSGISEVIRNHKNVILGYFPKNVGHGWAFEEEAKAIFHALFFYQRFLLPVSSSKAIQWWRWVGLFLKVGGLSFY